MAITKSNNLEAFVDWVEAGKKPSSSQIDYMRGAKIAGLRKIADARMAHGLV